ncbi:MAG: CHASE2 domain-containing protein [Bacillota bacterium]
MAENKGGNKWLHSLLVNRKFQAVAIVWIIIAVTAAFGLWERWELVAYDSWFNLRGVQKAPGNIAIIEIDDESIHEIGTYPWPRSTHVKLLEKLSLARAVGWDVSFDVPGDAAEDDAFAQAVGSAQGQQVLASNFTFSQEGGNWLQQMQQPIDQIMEQVDMTGFINMPTDMDNVVRGITPVDLNYFQWPYPSLSLALAMAAGGYSFDNLELLPDGLAAGSISVPWNGKDRVLINFWGPGRTFTYYRYADVLEGRVDPKVFKDSIVLIGPTSPFFKDDFPNPFTRGNMVLGNALPSPGVELHASAVASFLGNNYFYRADPKINILVILLAGMATVLLTRRLRPWAGLLAAVGIGAGLWLLTYGLWLKGHFWLNFVSPLANIVLTYAVITVGNFIEAELNRRRIQELFGRYVPPEVVSELVKRPEMIHLGGQKQEVTVVFSDIRGFTSYSEGLAPEEVVNRLNEYFTVMTEVIFEYGGTLDKYLGDGLMAVFGVPLPLADHAQRALMASMEMLRRLEDLNQGWAGRGEKLFKIGVGMNSGPVLVGNIGSPRKLEYTSIGEEVNLAARLESMNKEYKTSIIFSDRTLAYLDTSTLELTIEELGEVSVRGMEQPVKIYTIKESRQEEPASGGH